MDFSPYKNSNVTLRSNKKVADNVDYLHTDKVMQFVVGDTITSTQGNGDLKPTLRNVPFPPTKTGVDRTFKFERTGGEWRVNGVVFAEWMGSCKFH